MNQDQHPYAETLAARLLQEALKQHTTRNPGGLRALAEQLEIKQATVLSHMANGRMPIPFERVPELSTILKLDVATFSLAVLEQRAPAVLAALDAELHVTELAALSPAARRAFSKICSASQMSERHADIIVEVLDDPQPDERWLQLFEVPIIKMIREHFPQGVSMGDLELLKVAIEAVLDETP
jgi:hypothetical protein